MKYAPIIAGSLLGLLFIMSASVVLFGLAPTPEIPEGSPVAAFMAAFGPTGYMTFIKVLELLGGIFVAIPRTRNFGLLILGPIIVNILAFHTFVAKDGILSPILLGISALALFLLWSERKVWLALLLRPTGLGKPTL
jgi:putative oxidoreductase